MFRLSALAVVSAATMAILPAQSSRAQVQASDERNLLFRVEFAVQTGGQNAGPTLDVVFFGLQPQPRQAEDVVRNCLSAAAVVRPQVDVVGRAWHAASPNETDRQARYCALTVNALKEKAEKENRGDGWRQRAQRRLVISVTIKRLPLLIRQRQN